MKYFITERSIFLVPSKECYEEFDKLDEFMEILNLSKIDEIIKINKNTKGRNGYNTYNLVATIIFCFSQFRSSLREIEKLCVFDLRVIYLMRQQQSSYKAIENCINKYILPHGYEIFTRITKTIIDKFGLDTSNQYLDGSKFEANANKYKFVWKPIKYHNSLDLKIKELLNKMNIKFRSKELITSFELNEIIKKYVLNENIDITSIPTGKGKRLTEIQRNYKLLHQYLIKLLDYEEKEKICGERNSYYKTDHDATAMMLKKDYYSKYSNDFHAGYNGQVLVSTGLITLFGVFTVEDGNGNTEQRIKIVRNEKLSSDMRWSSSNKNEWSTATLNTYLNGDYYNGIEATSKSMVADTKYYLGGSDTSGGSAETYYSWERGTTVHSERSTSWNGKIALMYPSDYTYTYALGVDNTCYTDGRNCKSNEGGTPTNGWIYNTNSNSNQWVLSPNSGTSGRPVFIIYPHGAVDYFSSNIDNPYGVRPTMYLNSQVKIDSGDGSGQSPYQLSL